MNEIVFQCVAEKYRYSVVLSTYTYTCRDQDTRLVHVQYEEEWDLKVRRTWVNMYEAILT